MTVPVTIRFPDDLHAKLKASAERDLRTLNSEIVWLLSQALEGDDEDD